MSEQTAAAVPAKSKTELKKEEQAVKAAAREATKQPSQNGVTRPKSGTKTGRIWEISDALSAEKKAPIERKFVMEQATKEGINEATAATQYGRWRKFHGLKGQVAAPAAAAAPVAGSDVQATPAHKS